MIFVRKIIANMIHAAMGNVPALQDAFANGVGDHAQAEALLHQINHYHADIYNRKAQGYSAARVDMASKDQTAIDRSFSCLQQGSSPLDGTWQVLDVGTGLRDAQYFSEREDVMYHGIDISSQTIAMIRGALEIPDERLCVMDMGALQYSAETFHLIRAQASLHHIPVIAPGIGADQAVAEAYRVLRPGGVYQLLVKATDGAPYYGSRDTEEGLGIRYYQFYTAVRLREILQRNGFTQIEIEAWTDGRGERNLIAWAIK